MLDYENIAERVRDGRKALGMTQTQLAEAADVSRPTIARIEAGGAASVSLDAILRVLNAANWDLTLERGVRPVSSEEPFDMEAYLDSLFGDSR